jgi:hypothetical protein
MAPLVSRNSLTKLFIAAIEGAKLLPRNSTRINCSPTRCLALRAFVRMLYGAHQADFRLSVMALLRETT